MIYGKKKQIDGRSIKLSLDRTMQYMAEKDLSRELKKYGAEGEV